MQAFLQQSHLLSEDSTICWEKKTFCGSLWLKYRQHSNGFLEVLWGTKLMMNRNNKVLGVFSKTRAKQVCTHKIQAAHQVGADIKSNLN